MSCEKKPSALMIVLFKVSATRAVLRIGPLVFKVAMSDRGVMTNLLEWRFWQHWRPMGWLVPTRCSVWGLVNVQPYAGPTIIQMTTAHKHAAHALGILDPHPSNIAASYKGNWAFIDYACQRAMCDGWCHAAPCSCIGVQLEGEG